MSTLHSSGYTLRADLAAFGLTEAVQDSVGYQPPLPQTELHVTTSLEDVRLATQRVAASAQRLLSLCTTDLEPAVYDQPYFTEIAKRLVLGSPFARIRILVRDPGRMNSVTHRFVSMARRLSHSIDIRSQPDSMGRRAVSYCFSDTGSMIFRARADRWDGVTVQHNPKQSLRLQREFENAWRETESQLQQHSGYR